MKFVLVVVLFLVAFYGVVNAKTTDELIEETEKLLGSAPHVVATSPLAKAAAVQKPPMAKAMPVQQAKPVGGDLRFRNTGPFAGAEVNLAAPRQAPPAAVAPVTPGIQMPNSPMQGMPGMQMPGMQMPQMPPMPGMQAPGQSLPVPMQNSQVPVQNPQMGAAQQQQFSQPARPFAGPQSHSPWNPPAAGAAQQSSVPIGGVPPPPALLLETNSKLRGKRIEDALNAAAFGYGRAVQGAPASFGAPAFGERSARYNPAPVAVAQAPQGYSKANEIAKAEAWQRAHQGERVAATSPQAVAPPRFRQLFPQQANPINPFYRQHMASSSESASMELHNSIAELNNIPDASEVVGKNTRGASTEETPRFAENIVKSLPDLAKAASGDSTKAALKQPIDRAVSKPQYDNKKAVVEPKKLVEEKKAPAAAPVAEEKKAAPVTSVLKKKDVPAVEAPHKKHHHPVGLRRRATAIMRFNQIKAGHFRPSAQKIVFHDWVGKSKARVADRIRRTLMRSQ